ncbi:hypothetical protein B0H67DRAFT_395126 [Lasiosphaeris hirsuta]|uniref:Secreted protein n=1 Tax=Lasiosphaeris hirsuta TaxID=260670 RepID=A0AA40DIA7_9PEZI|nr:hypothetical protein B0H67DRAFT_395126 [Lasiosphaeris hirsuta]
MVLSLFCLLLSCGRGALIAERNTRDYPSPFLPPAGLMLGIPPASSHNLLKGETAVHERAALSHLFACPLGPASHGTKPCYASGILGP